MSKSSVVVLSLALLVSCSARQPAAPAIRPSPAPATEPEVSPVEAERGFDELYARVPDHEAVYREGIELIVAGEEVLGEEKIAIATNALLADSTECSHFQECDLQLFLKSFDRLLTEQGIAIKRQALRIDELETIAEEEDAEREPGTSPFAAAMPELGEAASLLRGTDLTEIIALNGPVKAALDDWLTWMRPMLMDSYHNYQFLKSKMAPVYEQAGLPEALLFAMLATETGGKVHSYSRAGATGPLQFMRRTGQQYGLRVVDGFDLRLDPEAATRANVGYLNDRFEELNDNLAMALAAYNGGEGRMRNLHRRHGSNVWDSKIYYALPRETREYVPRVLAAAWLFLHPQEYGLEFPVLDTETTMLPMRADTALDELSICLGQEGNPDGWFRTLRNLNPRLSPGDQVEAGTAIEVPASLVPIYEERCLDGEFMAMVHELHKANYPDEPELIRYTVRRGDTLSRIASRFRCASQGEIADINRLRAPRYTIRIGQTLKIPSCG
jgi:membrane-bound lytic murein transglycosylase D